MSADGFSIPDLIEPVVGFRSWTVRVHPSGEPRLCSPYRRHAWAPREAQTARCGVGDWTSPIGLRGRAAPPAHDAPASGCTCGVHAWRSRSAALMDAADTRGLRAVSGEVALWGEVLRHERGWRAALAYPVSLTVHPATTDGLCFAFSWETGQLRAAPAEELAPILQETYGVPVTIDPGEDPLGPLPRHAPSAARLPRAYFGLSAEDVRRLHPPATLRRRVARWFTQTS